MKYYLDVFSPETYEAFSSFGKNISGFRYRYRKVAKSIKPGDKFLCYLTKLSRWVGVLEVLSECYEDDTPRFFEENDPYIIRFDVKPIAWLDNEKAIPIKENIIWNKLSFTKDYDRNETKWTGKFRSSLSKINDEDGKFIEELIVSQLENGTTYPIDEEEYQKHISQRVRREDRIVTVSVPEDEKSNEVKTQQRESIKIQSLVAQIGERMGFKVWLPKNDRSRVLSEWNLTNKDILLEQLPLNYDLATLKTIEQIDVIWLKKRSIVRAFEIEHTTAVYSGLLRMADLLALQPNMDIKLHIIAPFDRRNKVFQELQRPVFSLLDKGPLSDICTFISYDSLYELAEIKHLSHLLDSVIEEYEEIIE